MVCGGEGGKQGHLQNQNHLNKAVLQAAWKKVPTVPPNIKQLWVHPNTWQDIVKLQNVVNQFMHNWEEETRELKRIRKKAKRDKTKIG